MANVTILNNSYSDVPAVTLPKTGGGTASFTDVTDTTAIASDVAQGKYFYLANGTKTAGTATGGGGTGAITQDQDGYLVLDSQGGGGGSRLPSEYQEVEYIDTNATGAYIITNYTPVQNDTFKGSVYLNSALSSNTNWAVYEADGDTYSCEILISRGNTGTIYYKYFLSGSAASASHTTTTRTWLYFEANTKCIIDGVAISTSYGGALSGNNTNLCLFNRYNASRSIADMKMGQFVVQNGSTIKLNLIPCYRKADTVIGMYDIVSDTFYTNSGQGAFLKGDDVIGTDEVLTILLGETE